MADPPGYFYRISNGKNMSHAKILLLNTFKFCEQPLILLGKVGLCIFIFYEWIRFWGNNRSSCAACCATQQLKPNSTFSILLFCHLLPVWDVNTGGGQQIKPELMVWADILPSSNNSSLNNTKSKENYSIQGRILIQDWLWMEAESRTWFPWSTYPHTAAMQFVLSMCPQN